MRIFIVCLLLSIAGVTFSAKNDDGNTIVNRYKRMSILAEAYAAKGTTGEPSSDSDDEGTDEPPSDSDEEGTAEPSDSDEEGTAEPSDSDEEGTAEPSDSDEEGSKDCPCGCSQHLVSPPICMRLWLENPDRGVIGRVNNKCDYNCFKCQAERWGFKVGRVKPASAKTCPENTGKNGKSTKEYMWCLFKPTCYKGLIGAAPEADGVFIKRTKGGECFKVPNKCIRDCMSKTYKGKYVNC